MTVIWVVLVKDIGDRMPRAMIGDLFELVGLGPCSNLTHGILDVATVLDNDQQRRSLPCGSWRHRDDETKKLADQAEVDADLAAEAGMNQDVDRESEEVPGRRWSVGEIQRGRKASPPDGS